MTFKCKYCENNTYLVRTSSGASLNAMGLYCKKCGKWQKWISKAERHFYINDNHDKCNPCMYCGVEIPEGIEVCANCEAKLTNSDNNPVGFINLEQQTFVRSLFQKISNAAERTAAIQCKSYIDFRDLETILVEVAEYYGFSLK